jgi:predicted O-methyltransferase YrrM
VTAGSSGPKASATALVEQEPGYGPPAPVPIFQWEAEFSELLLIYKERKPKRVLEIGTYHGGTLYHWLQKATRGTIVVSLDSYAVGVDNRHLYGDWVKPGTELHVLEGDSRKMTTLREVKQWAPYDWIFIDGGHFYEEVEADWRNYRPMCREGGVVIFHDILPPSRSWPIIQVQWLWKEIKRAGYETKEIIADPDVEWGGIGIVYL